MHLSGSSRAAQLVPVIVLLGLLFAVRAHAITAQDPFIDEGAHVARARVVWSFEENPGRFANGKLLLYYWLGLFPLPPVTSLYIARTAIAIFALVTGAAVYRLGRLVGGHGTGVIALAIYAILPLAFFHERMALADPFAAGFMALAVWRSVDFARRPTVRQALLVGALAAAAMLAKLTMGLVPLIPLAATLLYDDPGGAPGDWRTRWQRWRDRYLRGALVLWGVIAACWVPLVVPAAVAALEGEPFTLVNPANVQDVDDPTPVSEFVAAIPKIVHYTGVLLPLVAAIGLIGLIARGRHDAALRAHTRYLIAWLILLIVLPPLASRDLRTRYFMPLAVPLSVLGGWAIVALWRTRRAILRGALIAAAALWLIAFALPFARAAMHDPDALELPQHDAEVYLGGNFAGDAFREAAALLDAVEPAPDQIFAGPGTCETFYFFTARPLTCISFTLRPEDLHPGAAAYVVMNGHEPLPGGQELDWKLIAAFERPELLRRAGIVRTVQVWHVRLPDAP